jgi:hypothetical protein
MLDAGEDGEREIDERPEGPDTSLIISMIA